MYTDSWDILLKSLIVDKNDKQRYNITRTINSDKTMRNFLMDNKRR